MKLFVINSFSGVAQATVSAVITFVSIPLLIHAIGQEEYGIFCLVSIVGSLNTFSSLGINSALTRYISGQGKNIESNYDILVSLIFITLLGTILAGAVIAFRNYILLNFLAIPSHALQRASRLLIYLTISNTILLIGQIFTAALDGLSKIYLTSFTQTVYSIFYWGGIAILALAGYGLEHIGLAVLIAAVVWLVLVAFYFLHNWGFLQQRGVRHQFFRVLKKQLSYSLKIYSSGLIGFFYEPLTKIVIGHFIGVREAGYYDLAMKVKGQLSSIGSRILYPLYPYYAKSCGSISCRRITKTIQELLFLVAVPASVIVIFIASPLAHIWLQMDNSLVILSLAGITAGYLLFSIPVIPTYYYMGACGHPEILIYTQSINVVTNILLLIVLLPHLGYHAIIISNVGAIFSSFILLLISQQKVLLQLPFERARQLYDIAIMAILCITFAFAINVLLPNDIFRLIVLPLTVGIVAVSVQRALRMIPSQDILPYVEDIPFMKNILQRLHR